MLLEDKNAVIYGGGGAIGGAVARTFAREGARVFLAGRTLAKLDEVAREISAAGGRAETAELDALDERAVDEHADAVAAAAGGIDVALNAVGLLHVQASAPSACGRTRSPKRRDGLGREEVRSCVRRDPGGCTPRGRARGRGRPRERHLRLARRLRSRPTLAHTPHLARPRRSRSLQARGAAAAEDLVTTTSLARHTSFTARWPDWVGYAAAVWSVAYGVLGLYWTLGGGGFPFGVEDDPEAAKVSILERAQAETTAPPIAVLGLVAAVIAVRMARTRERGILHYPLAGFAWGLVTLAIVIPDSRPLMAVARAPIVLGGMPFGWPEGVGFFEPGMFSWPVANQLLIVLGGALWSGTALRTSGGRETRAPPAGAPTPTRAGRPRPAPPAGAAGQCSWPW